MPDATSDDPGGLLIEIGLGIQMGNVWKFLDKEMIA
jgi:hypothetical protein